jgi:hypothetical protein
MPPNGFLILREIAYQFAIRLLLLEHAARDLSCWSM